MGGKVGLRCKGKTLLGVVNKLCWTKSLLTTPSNVWPPKNHNKNFKCSRLLEGDGIESHLPFKIFSTDILRRPQKFEKLSQILEISGVFSQYLNFFSLFLGSSGASTISSQNSMSGSYCLCVAVKRQVIIYEITRLKSRHKRLREVLLPAQAQSLDVFSEGRLCVGYQSGNFELD